MSQDQIDKVYICPFLNGHFIQLTVCTKYSMYQLRLKPDQVIILFNIKYKIQDSSPCPIVYMHIKIIIPFSPISAINFLCLHLIVDISSSLITLKKRGYMKREEWSLETITLIVINVSLDH